MLSRSTFWLLVLCFLICCLFLQKSSREITRAYPRHFDQSNYLCQTYQLYEDTLQKGLVTSVRDELLRPTPTGVLFIPEGALSMHIFGASRVGCLSLNILHYCLALLILFICLRETTGLPSAIFALGLYLALASPFFIGGALDFRKDFVSVCLFTVLISLWIYSDGLRKRASTAYFTIVICVLIAIRFITAAYIAGIVGTIGIAMIGLYYRARQRNDILNGSAMRDRLTHSSWACLVVATISGGLLLYNRIPIYNYYGIGHVIGSEKFIRMAELGITDVWQSILFYPKSLYRDHLGLPFIILAGTTLAVAAGIFLRNIPHRNPKANTGALLHLVFLGTTFFVPLIVLTMDSSKSPVVGGIMAPSVVVGAALIFASLTRGSPRIAASLSVVALSMGFVTFLSNTASPSILAPGTEQAAAVTELYEKIIAHAKTRKLATPKIAFLSTSEFLNAYALNAWAYEKHGTLLKSTSTIGGGIFALTKDQIEAGLSAADVILLPDEIEPGGYPIFESLRQNFPLIKSYSERHFSIVDQSHVPGGNLKLYFRNTLQVEGVSGGWITASGINVELPPSDLGGEIVLSVWVPNNAGYQALPRAIVSLVAPNGISKSIEPTTEQNGDNLSVHIPLADDLLAGGGKLRICFDKFFVPKQLGINEDTRQLSVTFINLEYLSNRH